MDEDKLSDADLWEAKRKQGMSAAQATAYVVARRQQQGPMAKVAEGVGQALRGATFGFADEIAAPIVGAVTGEGREAALGRIRGSQDRFQADQPKTSAALNFGGALAMPAGGMAVGGIKGLLAGTAMGAASAGADAAGNAVEGHRGEALRDGAVVGGVLGAALPIVGRPLGKAAEMTGATQKVSKAVQRFAQSKAGKKTVGALDRVNPMLSASQRADDRLLMALQRGEMTPADAIARVVASQKPLGFVDVAGVPGQKVARAARTAGGKTAEALPEALERRTTAQATRITDDLTHGTGLTRPDVESTMEELIETRRQNAKPLYEKAYAAGEIADPDVAALFDLPQFQKAFLRAQRIARTEGVTLPAVVKMEKHGMHASPVRDAAVRPDVRTFDYVKRGLDDVIESGMRGGKMGRSEARALRQRMQEALAKVDEANPDYKAARAQFRGDTELKEAFEAAEKFLTMRPEQVQHAMAKMSQGEKELFRRRALDAILGRVDDLDDHLDASKRLGASPSKRERLRALFDSDASWEEFQRQLKDEADMFKSQHFITGGSNTTDKLTELMDLAGVSLPDMAMGVANPAQGFARAMMEWGKRTGKGYSERVSDELAPSLTAGLDGNKDEVVKLFERLAASAEEITRKRGRGAAGRRAASQTVGGASASKP
jgi:hypothetical protein